VIDLHTHSTASDGTDPPGEVVALARAAGCSAVALTDHDTLDHVGAARDAGAELGLRVVSGCELSCEVRGRAPGSMHLLVYFVDDAPGPLANQLVRLRAARDERNVEIVERLRGLGFDITVDDVRAVAGDATVGRPHIAQVLVDRGDARSIDEAFGRWLAKGRPAYRERLRLEPEEAIERAHASGGATSLAHPRSLGLEGAELDDFVAGLRAAGLDALESEYGAYSPDVRTELAELAQHHGLARTGGSDYHGTRKPGLAIAVGTGDLRVADELLDRGWVKPRG
jgi:predicted metal-dependent phosphoesterase TrpH